MAAATTGHRFHICLLVAGLGLAMATDAFAAEATTAAETATNAIPAERPRDWGAWSSLLSSSTGAATRPVTASVEAEPDETGLAVTFRLPAPDRCQSADASVAGSEELGVLHVELELESQGSYCPAVTAVTSGRIRVPQVPAGDWTIVIDAPRMSPRRIDLSVHD